MTSFSSLDTLNLAMAALKAKDQQIDAMEVLIKSQRHLMDRLIDRLDAMEPEQVALLGPDFLGMLQSFRVH